MRGAGHFLAGGVVLSALAMSCPTADAQTPYIIDQNRIDRVAPHPEMPLDGLRDREGVANATPERQLPEPAPTAHAPLATIALHGSSLPSAELQSAWQVEIGRAIDSAMIERISGALANIYRESDIALFTIVVPTQDFSNGAIEFRIIEGRVSSVLVQTDDQDAADIERIRAYADPLVTEEPLSRAKLERQLSFIRDIPGQKIEAAFTPIAAGRSDVRLTITARRNHADIGVSLSNRPTPLLGDSQASVDASVNGYLRGGDKLSLAYTAPLEDDLFRYFGLNYTTPVGTDGLTASFNVSALETHPAEAPIEGNSEAASVAFSYPLLRSFTESTIVSFGFDALNNQNSVFGQSIDTSRTRVFRGALSHALTNENSFSSLAISASLGVDALGAEVNELYADADFFKLSAQGAWIYGFENRTVLRLRGQAQISGDQLPPSEQFALGGDLYGRAFASGLIQGDKGIAGSLEAAYRPELSFAPFLAGSEIYAFTDAGTVWTADRSTFEGGDASLSSFGAGARFLIANSVSIGLEASRPIDAPSADREEDDWRFLYSLRATAP